MIQQRKFILGWSLELPTYCAGEDSKLDFTRPRNSFYYFLGIKFEIHHFSKSRLLPVSKFYWKFVRIVKKVKWFCLGSSESKVLTFILLSCSHVHSITWSISRSSSLLRPFKNWFQDSKFTLKSFWSNESLIREICHAKKSSCEGNVTNLVFLRVCKPVNKMRVLGGLCLHLVAGYQVSLSQLFWWQSIANNDVANLNLDRVESNWWQSKWRLVKLSESWWGKFSYRLNFYFIEHSDWSAF